MNDYQYYKKIKVCPRCRRNKPVDGRTMCPDCLEKNRKNQNAMRAKMTDERKTELSDYLKSRYYRLKEEGICVKCGKEPATHGTMCFSCRSKAADRNRKYMKKARRIRTS